MGWQRSIAAMKCHARPLGISTVYPHLARRSPPCGLLPLLALLAGCATPPPAPLDAPRVTFGSQHFTGSVLTGCQPAAPEDVDFTDALQVRCRIRYLRGRRDDGGLVPLATRTRLVFASLSGQPLQPAAQLAGSARIGHGSIAQRYLANDPVVAPGDDRVAPGDDRVARPPGQMELGELRGLLPVGVTVACVTRAADPVPSTESGPVRQRVVVLISRDAAAAPPSVALQIDGLVTVEDEATLDAGESAAAVAVRTAMRRQLVLLQDAPEVDGAPLVLEFPSPFPGGAGNSFVVVLELSRAVGDPAVRADAVARCRAELGRANDAARRETAPVDDLAAAALGVGAALRSLDLARFQRPGLVFLAGAVDARLALDLSLVADDAVLTAWVRAADPGGVAWAPGGDPGWVLERSAYALLAERLDADELSVELRAVLTEHAGEAARFPGAIAVMLQKCRSRDQLLAALVAENREALDAADPASRVRAFDWLVARKLAPPGFDPLAARAARRAALAAAQAASAAAAAPAPAAANAGAAAGSEVGR